MAFSRRISSRRSPPHPRGSTPHRLDRTLRRLVSPAPAGIDLVPSLGQQTPAGLPRTRGDRPDVRRLWREATSSPPHPRGSTCWRSACARSPSVSPAPAGIDLAPWSLMVTTDCLPRTRGDRPICGLDEPHVSSSPPHPRGSTCHRHRVCFPRLVSPAPAGIDLPPVYAARCLRRLPRTRGDRPVAATEGVRDQRSPPHPRGSTPALLCRRILLAVSPAPAGIDPLRKTSQTRGRGLPRTRGDRPDTWRSTRLWRMSPPHPRGSTPTADGAASCATVSPAPAGIDLLEERIRSLAERLPRTRGDRPGAKCRRLFTSQSPPHPRGSTGTSARWGSCSVVSPAPAGIDPGGLAYSR